MVDDICERAVKFAEEDLTETGDDHCQIDCSRKPYDNSTNGDDSNDLIKRSFPVNRNKTALVIIDMQEDFLSKEGRLGKFYSEETLLRLEKTIKNVEELLGKARECGMTVAHSRSHRYGAQVRRDLLNGIDVMTKNSPIDGVDKTYNFVKECMPIEGEIIVDKWTFGAFASTDLEMKLRERGVERILLCGILTNVCVFATAVQAVDRFFRVCLVEDCCGAFGDGWHEKAVELINGPQIAKKNHHKSVGLYFGEVASLENACAALNTIVK
jgi:biuret amidohydrolase